MDNNHTSGPWANVDRYIPMPEPVAYRSKDQPYLFGMSASNGSSERWDGLITTAQAETYANARIEASLRQIYLKLRQIEKDLFITGSHVSGPQAASFAANQVLALLSKEANP